MPASSACRGSDPQCKVPMQIPQRDFLTGSSSPAEPRWRAAARTAFPFIVVGALWELVARLAIFPPRLFPSLEVVASAFVRLTASGVLPHHVLDTLLRLAAGFALAAAGRRRRRHRSWAARASPRMCLLPLVSMGAPIPGIAYAPLFLLWFGLGNVSAVLLVGFVSAFPVIFNTWTGVKAVKEIWVRAALAMGADDRRLFAKVILPGALPYILTGLRLGLAQAWRILVGVEMLAAVPWGLGWMIFGAREFLNTDVMLAGVAVIGVDRPGAGEARIPAPGALHGRALGDDDMSGTADRGRSARRAAVSLALAAAAYEALARSGVFPAALLPTLPAVGRALVEGVLDGSLPAHAASTLYRVLIGMGLAVLIGVPLGILMGRFRSVEGFFLPLASALMPIPSLAWVPVFILWFGLGNATAIGIVFYAALFPAAAQRLDGRARRQSAVAARRLAPWARTSARCSGR